MTSINGMRKYLWLDKPLCSTRFFWWKARDLTFRWRPLYWGTDENCNRTLGVRLPGGVLFVCLNIPLRQKPHPDH